jgi:hypothetical protein
MHACFEHRALGGLLGESAAGVGAAGAALRISTRHDAFQFSPHYYSILSTVDIRRVGTQTSEYSSWGVPRKNQ